MRVGIATDHGGFGLKKQMVAKLQAAGHELVDFGADDLSPDDDYPDVVIPLARAVAEGKVDRGVAICGSGVGASVCANKDCGYPRSADPRPLFSQARGRGRPHEHPLHGRPDDGTGAGLGPY
jgi:ribose/galactose isomerase